MMKREILNTVCTGLLVSAVAAVAAPHVALADFYEAATARAGQTTGATTSSFESIAGF